MKNLETKSIYRIMVDGKIVGRFELESDTGARLVVPLEVVPK